ncbi:Uncharacterised protein [Enterobacter hormaechei]|nr:Uncharacterised protein [Enterobacter hormaechei]
MKSGETAGHGNGHPCVPTARKRSAQARSWKPGRRRQPSGARERWKPDRGETPQGVRCAARQRDPAMPSWPGDAEVGKDGQHGFDALGQMRVMRGDCRLPAPPGRRSCREGKRSAADAKASTAGATEKWRVAPRATRRMLAATVGSSCSITPGSTNTHGCSSATGTLNTWTNTPCSSCARRPVRYACSGFMRQHPRMRCCDRIRPGRQIHSIRQLGSVDGGRPVGPQANFPAKRCAASGNFLPPL